MFSERLQMQQAREQLGPPIRKQEEKPDWTPVPGKPHLEQNAKGQFRTVLPVPLAWPFYTGNSDEDEVIVVWGTAFSRWVCDQSDS